MEALFHRKKTSLEMKPVDDKKPAFKDIQVCEVNGFVFWIVFLQGEDIKRRPSINLYQVQCLLMFPFCNNFAMMLQSVDEDHPDLQSIQSIVANMNFSADDD